MSKGKTYFDIEKEISVLEQKQSTGERFVNVFPGFFGKMLIFQFGTFLNEPIISEEQKIAYNRIIEFLDNMPKFELPEDLRIFFEKNTKDISRDTISEMIDSKNQSIEDIEEFMIQYDKEIKFYLQYRQSEEYKCSDAAKIKNLFSRFMSTSGFHDIFISNMRKLSSSYDLYYLNLIKVNEKFSNRYNINNDV